MKRTQLKNLTTQNIIDAIRWGSDLFDSIAGDTYHNNSINNVNPRLCRFLVVSRTMVDCLNWLK